MAPALGAATPRAAEAAKLDPSAMQWLSIQKIENKTPYELRLLDSTKTEMTNWLKPATGTISARGEGRAEGESVVQNTPVSLGHGVAQLITYGLYLDGKYDGMMVLASGVDCTKRLPFVMTCTEFHRWQHTWITTTNQKWKVFAVYDNNDGPPDNWQTHFVLEQRDRPNSSGPLHTKLSKFNPLPAQSGGARSTVDTAPGDAPTLNGGLGPWGVTQIVDNHSPYIFKKIMTWSSTGTSFLGHEFPDQMLAFHDYQTLYANYATWHGPNAFAMYEAIDPLLPRDRNHLGGLIIEAATNCNVGVKIDGIPTTCGEFNSASFSIASAIERYKLSSHAESSGVPPYNLLVNTVVTGDATPPAPTTTTLPPTPPTLDCAASVDAQASVAAANLHLCTSAGRPLPTVEVTGGALPEGTKLERSPGPDGTDLVLAGTPTAVGTFPVHLRARSEAGSVEADVTVEVRTAPAPTTTTQPAGGTTSFPTPEELGPKDLTTGPDGALWFTAANDRIGRMATDGAVTSFGGDGIADPQGITTGPDGALWFANLGSDSIGRITTDGVVSNFRGDGISRPRSITAGPDGALWFTNTGADSVGRITTAGQVSKFAGDKYGQPQNIVTGPDRNLWYTSINYNMIYRLTPAGRVASFTADSVSSPDEIVSGPDGNLWFTNSNRKSIGRITPGGEITKFSDDSIRDPNGLTVGPDDNLWFTDASHHAVSRLTPAGVTTDFVDRNHIFSPQRIAAGPDGAVWFVNSNPTIGRVST